MSVPEACMEYTKVFTTLNLEVGIVFLVGIAFGFFLYWWSDR